MTAQTSDFSGLLFYNPAGPGFNPVPQATIHCPDSMDEGDRITVDLVTWGIPDGTELRHLFPVVGLNPTTRFSVFPRFPVVTNNRASFYVEVFADHATAPGSQSFDIIIQNKLTGLTLATKYGITVNDTSLTPAKPTGLIRKTYNGYYYTGTEASQWFKDKTPIDTLIGAPLGDGDPGEVRTQHLSYEWVGYFSPPATDDYTFHINSDDYTLVWIGSNAVSAYTNSNADIACATSQSAQSSAITLTGGDFVPIRIQFGNDTGGGELHVSWSSTQHPTPSRNFDWLIYHDTEAVTTYSVSIRSYDTGTNTPGDVITTCNEGDTIYIEVQWANLNTPGGLNSYLQLGGANITDQDITILGLGQATDPVPIGSDTQLPGFDPAGGTAGSPILINADSTTEGNETLTWKWYVNSSVVASATCTIVDTSQDPAPPGPSFNQVISLNPNYIATNGGTSIPNDTDEGSTSATVVGAFTSSPAQGGTITLIDTQTSAVYLPVKHVKTIGMWIKIIDVQSNSRYLLDSRERVGPNSGLGTGYFYSGGVEGWTLMSINGAPADNSLWATVANNTNVWQYVTLINQTDTPLSITLFNRYTLAEGLATIQVGRIEAWDYIQLDSQIAAAYASHSSNYV